MDLPRFSPVYFLYGPERYLIEAEVQALLDRVLPARHRGMNFHPFSGGEHGGREIVQVSQTLPMFSPLRLVLVKDADRMDEEDVDAVMAYLGDPSPTTCLVLCGASPGPWKKRLRELEKTGKVVEYPRLKGKALATWIRRRMTEKGKTLAEEAAEFLSEVVGDSLQDLDQVLEKAFLRAGPRSAVTLSDVEEMASDVKASTVYDLMDAIGRQNLEKALAILDQILETKEVLFKRDAGATRRAEDPVPLLLSMMAKEYRSLWRVKEALAGGGGAESAAGRLGMSPWSVKKLAEQERRFSVSALREGILTCHRTDLAVKRGRGPKDLLMQRLVVDLCRPPKNGGPER
jgi:DNA polymerase-3 subunit delta